MSDICIFPNILREQVGDLFIKTFAERCYDIRYIYYLVDYEIEQLITRRREVLLPADQYDWRSIAAIATNDDDVGRARRVLSAVCLWGDRDIAEKSADVLSGIVDFSAFLLLAHDHHGILKRICDNHLKKEMVYVKQGSFVYGSDIDDLKNSLARLSHLVTSDISIIENWLSYEIGKRIVFLDGYWISRNPITNSLYSQIILHDFDRSQHNHPVTRVSWHDAMKFCDILGCNIPNEIEWEKAARGADGRFYAWGNTPDIDKCNVFQSGIGGTTPVGLYKNESPYGCVDCNGNVWEWTSSHINHGSPYMTIRGGGWVCSVEFARSTTRCWAAPDDRSIGMGFRIVRESFY